MAEEEGLVLETSPLASVKFRTPEGEETEYWIHTDMDPILFKRVIRWFDAGKEFSLNDADPPSYDELYKLAGQILVIEPESARAYGARSCIRLLDFLLRRWLPGMNTPTSSIKPPASRSRSKAASASVS